MHRRISITKNVVKEILTKTIRIPESEPGQMLVLTFATLPLKLVESLHFFSPQLTPVPFLNI